MLHLKENMLYQSIIVVMIEYLKLFEMLYFFSGHKANKISDSMMCKTCITINGGQFLFARQKSLCLIKQHFSSILKMSLKPLYSHIITNSKKIQRNAKKNFMFLLSLCKQPDSIAAHGRTLNRLPFIYRVSLDRNH